MREPLVEESVSATSLTNTPVGKRDEEGSGREIDASQAERLGRSCLSIACSALLLARSAQAERDNESCFFLHAAGIH
ncbi:hypothetical protein EVAR_11472_1 [Eumeta japonica]|uniref:Uncharacterized protein n=1 Tax=Eumeta variegata TaxID=151549 RepID=A0A4C1TNG3_EUMVA|nr:hypothetical protein EVAR_11472_1 [Eumeta japonica]